MHLRRTAAAAAIAALGGIAVLSTAPTAEAAGSSGTCPVNGNISIAFSGLDQQSIPQGTGRDSVVTVTNNTGHDVSRFMAMLAVVTKKGLGDPTVAVSVTEKSGSYPLVPVPGSNGVYSLVPVQQPVDLAAGAKLTYRLRFGTTAATPLGGYAAEAIAASLSEGLPSLKGRTAGLSRLAHAMPQATATTAPDAGSCDYGYGQALFDVTAPATGSPSPSAPASASPTASASTEPVSAVSTSPAAVPSDTASATGAALAETGGGSSGLPIALGGALVVLGAGAVVISRRRRAARH